MDFIEVLLGRIFRNGVYKHRTPVNDFSRHATNQFISLFLSLHSMMMISGFSSRA